MALVDRLRDAVAALDQYGQLLDQTAEKQAALFAQDPRVAPPRPPAPAPGVSGGGGGPRPFVRSDLRAGGSQPLPTAPAGGFRLAGGGTAPPAGPGLPAETGQAPPTRSHVVMIDGKPYDIAGYGLVSPSTEASAGGAGSARPSGAGLLVPPPGFDAAGNVLDPRRDVSRPAPPTKGDEAIVRAVNSTAKIQADSARDARANGKAVADRLDRLTAAVRNAGHFELRSPL